MPLTDFVRAALPVFFTVIAVMYTMRLLAGRARQGVRLSSSGPVASVQHVTHGTFRVFRGAIWAVCIARAVWPETDRLIGVFTALYQGPVLLFGLVLLIAGFGLVSYCHTYMGENWRSGVADEGVQDFVASGPFAHIRHPIFLGVMIAQVGLFFALPSLFTLICLVVGTIAIGMQTRYEERRMLMRYGTAFRLYCEQTPRWLPRLRRA